MKSRNVIPVVCLLLTLAGGILFYAQGWNVWLGLLVGINLATFIVYGWDKSCARRKAWRVPENTLHVLAALGGSPGAAIGQLAFRHKTADRKFRLIFFAIVIVQAALVAVWFWRFQ